MSFERALQLLFTIWCVICLLICLLGVAVGLVCSSDVSTCGDVGFETGNVWIKLWWTVPLFGAGAIYGVRHLWPDLPFPRKRKAPR